MSMSSNAINTLQSHKLKGNEKTSWVGLRYKRRLNKARVINNFIKDIKHDKF